MWLGCVRLLREEIWASAVEVRPAIGERVANAMERVEEKERLEFDEVKSARTKCNTKRFAPASQVEMCWVCEADRIQWERDSFQQ